MELFKAANIKRVRFSHLFSFFNFVRNNIDPELGNPCDTPMIRKIYREKVTSKWEIIEKETVDEIIFRTMNVRNRLILELMAISNLVRFRVTDAGQASEPAGSSSRSLPCSVTRAVIGYFTK